VVGTGRSGDLALFRRAEAGFARFVTDNSGQIVPGQSRFLREEKLLSIASIYPCVPLTVARMWHASRWSTAITARWGGERCDARQDEHGSVFM
jgi:hypothetical protein